MFALSSEIANIYLQFVSLLILALLEALPHLTPNLHTQKHKNTHKTKPVFVFRHPYTFCIPLRLAPFSYRVMFAKLLYLGAVHAPSPFNFLISSTYILSQGPCFLLGDNLKIGPYEMWEWSYKAHTFLCALIWQVPFRRSIFFSIVLNISQFWQCMGPNWRSQFNCKEQ